MTAISYHDTVNVLQDPDWVDAGPFARPAWFRLLEEAGHRPLLAVARDGNDRLCLPLERAPNGLAPLPNWYAFTWQPLRSDAARADLLAALTRDLASQTHRVDLMKLDEFEAAVIAEAFREAGWRVLRETCDVNRHISITSDYAGYLANRPGPLRTTIKRKAKKLEVHLATRFDPADWAEYEAIYAESWKPAEGDPALLRSFAEAESARGHYRFALARHEGQSVAAQFWTAERGTAYIHKLAHRPSTEKLSSGTVLTGALMRHVIDVDGVEKVDFGTGDDAYKRDWMNECRARWRLTCLRPGAPRNWPVLAKAMLRELVSRGGAG